MKKKSFNFKHKLPIAISLLGVFSAGTLLYININHTIALEKVVVAESNGKTIYPTQYSDKHITVNAVTTDPRFKSLAIFDKNSLLANTISAVSKKNPGIVYDGKEKGTWLWTPILEITPKYRESIIAGALKNGVSNIYLSIDSYLDILVMPDGEEKTEKKKAFDKSIEDFIVLANKNNITVDAEGGWRNWAEAGNSYKAFTILKYVMQFNKNHVANFRGFQYDVEPYLLDAYKKDKQKVLTNFLDLVNESVTRLHGSNLQFFVVIPDFYDGTNAETPEFSYRGKTGFAIDHLLNVMDRRENSRIIIMSYRNFSKGDDGTIDISKSEILRANIHDTKIIIGQETGDVLPPYITFNKTSKTYFNKQLEAIQKTFDKEKSYNGVAIHYVNAFMDLK